MHPRTCYLLKPHTGGSESPTPGLPLVGPQERRHRGPASLRFHIWAPDCRGGLSGRCGGTGSSSTDPRHRTLRVKAKCVCTHDETVSGHQSSVLGWLLTPKKEAVPTVRAMCRPVQNSAETLCQLTDYVKTAVLILKVNYEAEKQNVC